MRNGQDNKLHILGKVSASVVKKLQTNGGPVASNTVWLFVGYSFHEYPTGTSFDIFINESTRDWNHDYKIKLSKIYDEFGRSYNIIPEGYKTICLFECQPSVPAYIKKLPALKTWEVTGESIYLCNHADIDLLYSGSTSEVMFRAFSKLVVSALKEKHKHTFTEKEIINILPKEAPHFIIDNLLLSGTLKKKSDNKLILVG